MQTAPHHPVAIHMQPHDGKESDAPPYPYARAATGPQPNDYVLWSLFSFSFLNACCLGFAALVFSIKSRDRKVVGDPEGATTYGKTSKCLNIAALIVSVIILIISIIILITFAAAFQAQMQEMMKKRH
ncbi:dispanin subfamily A member 2b-like [Podarcis raffonei]|uniref:dispanin subfamily A member 2b-like n=1 Tax=Podarcis raffonei TaxID=65483 RepID=UPI00232951C2|nr:dispanin subfamily A member 2b-like [Podarcis raffonei]